MFSFGVNAKTVLAAGFLQDEGNHAHRGLGLAHVAVWGTAGERLNVFTAVGRAAYRI